MAARRQRPRRAEAARRQRPRRAEAPAAAAAAGAAVPAAADTITVDVLVQPRASRDRFGPVHGDRIKVAVTAAPVDGDANAAVVALVARTLGVARSAIEIVAGAGSRRKTIRIRGVTRAAIAGAVGT